MTANSGILVMIYDLRKIDTPRAMSEREKLIGSVGPNIAMKFKIFRFCVCIMLCIQSVMFFV